MLTSAEIKKICVAPNLLHVGSEGTLFAEDSNSIIAKERIRSIVNRFANSDPNGGCIFDPLAERKRKSIHSIANLALSAADGPITYKHPSGVESSFKIKFIHLEQATKASHASVSIMERAPGRLDSQHNVDTYTLKQKMQELGIEVDTYGSNVFVDENNSITLLEVLGGIHPEILKYCEKLPASFQDKILHELAKVYLLGGCEPYPTVSAYLNESDLTIWPKLEAEFLKFAEEPKNFATVKRLNAMFEEAGLEERRTLENLFACGNREPEILRAFKFFGNKFRPQKFDWKDGNNIDIYGVSTELFEKFIEIRDKLKGPFSQIAAAVSNSENPSLSKRRELLKLISEEHYQRLHARAPSYGGEDFISPIQALLFELRGGNTK